jgi:IclR family transcriptional regulator, acetate operon repressor
MARAEGEKRYSLAADRVLDILDAVQGASDGISLHDLARQTGMPKSTVLRYLTTLVRRRYVDRDLDSGDYRLGLAVPSQAQLYAQLSLAAHPAMQRLEARFGEMVTLGVLDGDRLSLLDVVESSHVVRLAVRLGDRNYLHSTALGKAVASTLPEQVVRAALASSGMPQRTERTIVDMDVLLGELERVRARGYAIADQENDIGARSVAVPLPTRGVHAAIAIIAVATRFPIRRAPEAAAALKEAAGEILRAMEVVGS